MTKNFNILVNKLNSFRLKFYFYQLLKGVVLSLFFVLLLYTGFSVIEYFVYMSSEIREIVFFGFLIFSFFLLIQFIVLPLLKLLHVLKPIDDKAATTLIQKHFSDIKDRLLNIIELSGLDEKAYSNEILLASIDQKIEQLKIFDFSQAVQFKNMKMVSVYFLFSVLVSLGIVVINKNIFTESTKRIIHYNTQYTKPAPFTFSLENSSLKVKKGDSYVIKATASGNEIPQMVYVNIEGNNYLMKNSGTGTYEFEMVSVINPVQFYFTDLKYKSDIFRLQLLPKPGITQFKSKIFPPTYTGIPNQVFDNIGDLQIPNGTKVEWMFTGIDIDSVSMITDDSLKIPAIFKDNAFYIDKNFYKSTAYNVYIQNRVTDPELALTYNIDVIPDLFPEINIVQIKDSTQLTRYFFKGVIGDDYGFTNLKFHYNIDNTDSAIAIQFVPSMTDQDFYFSFDFKDLNTVKGAVSYYFSVTDNDVINHYKTTTSDNYIFDFPDKEEILAKDKEQFDLLQKNINESKKLAQEIQEELKNLQIKNMDTNVSDWEKSQMVNDVISKQNKLEQLYDKIKQDNDNLNNYLNSFNQNSEEIKEKQKQIEDLLNEVFTDELKELMKEFNKLADEFDSKKLNQLSDKLDMSYDDLQKQLDRNLEMLRKMKIEQNIQSVIDQVSKIAEEENQLANEVQENKNFEEVKEKVNDNQSDIKQLQQNLNDALELNQQLEEPLNFDDFSEEFEDVDKSFEDSKSQLDKKNKKKSEESTKQTSEKLKNMAFGMQQMLDKNTQQQNMENIANLKQILSNLMYLSFSQESVLTDLQNVSDKDPELIQLNQQQKKIQDQSNIVRDSLYALAKRTPAITSMVNNELLTMEINLNKATDEMEEGTFPNARVSQQFVMTSLNNLALMLNEALENLEEQMANALPGDQECENPGGSNPNMGMLKQASQNIKQQLQQMIEQMKNGDSQNMGKEMGQSLMQHEMMQQMLRDLMNGDGVGSDAKQTLQQIDQMLEQNRKELISKSISAQTIARQNLITTRLLEAEKAEMEREFDDKRESKSADEFYSNPLKFFEYKENDNFTIEYLNRNSHKLSNFYNNKYKQYLNNIEN